MGDSDEECDGLRGTGCNRSDYGARRRTRPRMDRVRKRPKPIFDTRLRIEQVDQEPIVNDAHATTFRARLGFETGKAWNTSLLIEGEAVMPIQDDYRPDPTVATMTAYPVVADPETYEINRLQLTNTSLPGTTLTLGRQRIALDDQRFVGPVGWRQNEQTFDAFRMVNRSVTNLVLDATYFNRVNRIFGDEFAAGRLQGRQFPAQRRIPDEDRQDQRVCLSTRLREHPRRACRGARLHFDLRPAFRGREARRARSNWRMPLPMPRRPTTRTTRSTSISTTGSRELSATFRQFAFGVGAEIMEGNGRRQGLHDAARDAAQVPGLGRQVPHDAANGIEDLYANARTFKGVASARDAWASSRAITTTRRSAFRADYGNEWNVSLAAKHKHFNAMLKYADYEQGDAAHRPRHPEALGAVGVHLVASVRGRVTACRTENRVDQALVPRPAPVN